LLDAFWILTFITSWCLLYSFWNTPWVLLCGPLFLCHLGGISEFVHQTVHLNLFARNRTLNRVLGTAAGAMIGMDYSTYRSFHLDHHRYANTSRDPERPLYNAPKYLALINDWADLPNLTKIKRVAGVIGYTAEALTTFGGNARLVAVTRWIIPFTIALAGYVEGLVWYLIVAKLAVVWFIPLFALIFVEITFAQSEHYGTGDPQKLSTNGSTSVEEQYQLSWNLKIPAVLEYLVLKRNIHAEHHLVPSIHWTQARDQGRGRILPLSEHLRLLWMQGPRT
jgi:fatty acid desaturase